MSELRDVRLRRALDEAPDAQLRPPPRVRDAVLQAAREAVAPPLPWWKHWFAPARNPHMPWNAALATFLLAGFVTLLWQGQEVPEATVDVAQPATTENKVAPPAAARSQPASAPRAEAVAPAPAVAQPRVPASPPSAAAQKRDANQAKVEEKARPSVAPDLKSEARERPAGSAVGMADAGAAGQAPATSAPAPAQAPAAPSGPATAAPTDALAKQAAPAAAPLAESASPRRDFATAARPAPAPVTAPAAAPAAARRAASLSATPWTGWDQARIESAGRTVTVARSQGTRLADAIDRLLRTESSTTAPDEPLDFQITLTQGTENLGVLLLGRTQARWWPGDGGAPRTYRHGAEVIETIRRQ